MDFIHSSIFAVVLTGVFQLLSFAAGGIILAFKMTKSQTQTQTAIVDNITALQRDVMNIQLELKKLTEVIVEQTRQNQRTDEVFRRTERLERWYDDLRRGVGWIVKPAEAGP